MPDLYCQVCDGEGNVPCIYVNESRKTYRLSIRGCLRCNAQHERMKEGEVVALRGVTAASLCQNGYRDSAYVVEYSDRFQDIPPMQAVG